MIVLVLNQFRHIVIHLHLTGRPVLVQTAQNAVAVTAHPHEQFREGHAVVHELHHFIAHKLQFRIDDHGKTKAFLDKTNLFTVNWIAYGAAIARPKP